MKPTQALQSTLQQAMALHQAGRPEQAEPIYSNILASDPNQPDALHLMGVLLWQRGDLVRAEEYVRKAIKAHDKNAAYFNNLAGILKQKGSVREAEAEYRTAIKVDPDHAPALYELGIILNEKKEYKEAETVLARGAPKMAANPDMWSQYGYALMEQMKYEEAKKAYYQALELAPHHVVVMNNLATVLKGEGDARSAFQFLDRALSLRPDYAQARYNRAILSLTCGWLYEGWADLAATVLGWLANMDSRDPAPWLKVPLWNGSDLRGKKIALWGDQGIGDEILFASMVPDLIAQGAEVVLECTDRLVPIFARSFPQVKVMARMPNLDPNLISSMDWQAPGLWLGHWLRGDFAKFPARKSYLSANSERTEQLRARYQALGCERIIGISWDSKGKPYRSVPFRELVTALPHGSTALIDLQYGDTSAEHAWVKKEFPDALFHRDADIDQLQNLDDFAAQVAACDEVITIGNTTSHIAGALGIPCTALLPSAMGLTWYWFTRRGDCPWYPSIKLLRQEKVGDWGVLAKLKN